MRFGLQIELEEIGKQILLRLDGRLDASSSQVLERKIDKLIEEGHLHLLLDFTRIDYLSSAGLRLLLSSAKKLSAEKGSFVLFSLQDEVLDVVKMAGFDRILQICSTEKEALQLNK